MNLTSKILGVFKNLSQQANPSAVKKDDAALSGAMVDAAQRMSNLLQQVQNAGGAVPDAVRSELQTICQGLMGALEKKVDGEQPPPVEPAPAEKSVLEMGPATFLAWAESQTMKADEEKDETKKVATLKHLAKVVGVVKVEYERAGSYSMPSGWKVEMETFYAPLGGKVSELAPRAEQMSKEIGLVAAAGPVSSATHYHVNKALENLAKALEEALAPAAPGGASTPAAAGGGNGGGAGTPADVNKGMVVTWPQDMGGPRSGRPVMERVGGSQVSWNMTDAELDKAASASQRSPSAPLQSDPDTRW